MTVQDSIQTALAQDGYDAYYAEKIWRLIPGIYRDEDFRAKNPGTLRALVDVLGEAAADQRRSVDRLWADSSIVDCDDWAIPYIAELLGTRLISEQNTAGRRADVANTIKYRRHAGTVALLVMLAEDIAGWDAVPSEAFKRLFRNWHSLDCSPTIGPVSETPQHGLARLNHFRVGETTGGTFDDVAHFPDFRRLRGHDGRYNIPKVNLHVFRQQAFLLRGVTPHDFGSGRYTLDPSGRDINLFQPGQPFAGTCKTFQEWQVRRPLTCALFNDGRYQVSNAVAGATIGDALLTVQDFVFRTATDLINRATSLNGGALSTQEVQDLLQGALLADSNRANLFDDAISLANGPNPDTDTFGPGELFAADLSAWDDIDAGTPWILALVDPATGRVRTDETLVSQRYYEGRFAPVGAGSHDRQAGLAVDAGPAAPVVAIPPAPANYQFPTSGIHQFNDSQTYSYAPGTGLTLDGDLQVQAANGERPYIRIPAAAAAPALPQFVIDADQAGRDITLDGLWLGLIEGLNVGQAGTTPVAADIVLSGGFNRVCLRNMTLDPGGERAALPGLAATTIPTVRLIIAGASDLIEIDRCVTGPIEEALNAQSQCAAGTIRITDSIIRAGMAVDGDVLPAFRGRHMGLEISRSTLFGNIEAARYLIEDSIVFGTVSAQDPQGSCLRYSAVADVPGITLAHPYRCVTYPDALPANLFVSRRFGDAGFAQLSETVPDTIRRGAENTSEMGVFNRSLDAIKRDDLTFKLSEFTAINTITQLVYET